ncbi:DUF664 domain-containing protein [Saccharopolyspora erythraea]|uniref:DinB family protein n=1 Tax=Saccharopolyspora erythraea TaxID=1836 RepID=UPI001BA9E954|nr:DinB family protein [Saccharopolyspora erythraea]QUH03100.1 DUF664 domain-containing protein [Saccharopolyspora erythraea]
MGTDDFLLVADRALDGMARIVADLGDDLANRRPDLPGANSPYQLLTHCLGLLEYWVGELVAGRRIERDRDAEFTASGPAAPLAERAASAKAQLRHDLAALRPGARLNPTHRSWIPPEHPMTQETALLHVIEELCQHHGHMEITRDLLLAATR